MEGFDPGLIYFYLTLPPDADTDIVEARLLEELGRITSEGVTEAELQKARNIMIADHWRDLSTINGKAAALGRAEVFHDDYQLAFSLPDELAAVTTTQIQQVASDVFNRDSMTVGVLRSAGQEVEQ
jgi:zinc protease